MGITNYKNLTLEQQEVFNEIKSMKQDDEREAPKVEAKFIWDNDIRQDRTDFWDH